MQNSSYTYSPPLHHHDPYRQPGSMAPVHAVNLPPLRIDGHIQHHQAYSQPQQSQMPSPPMTGYYTQAPPVMYHSQHISHMPAGPYRSYGIPITHTRSNKKEIKRRTKTGCMTCRKRRIKCDEQKPVCRNCVKSKRECQGYDPLYKNQPGPGQQQRNNSTTSCCTPQPSQSQRLPSPPASTSSASTTTASSPTTATSTGITTPSSSISYCSSSASNGALVSTASFSHQTYSSAPLSHSYSTAPVSQSYSTAPMTQSYSTAPMPQYSAAAISQSYTLPSPLSSSRPSPMQSYYSTNTATDPLQSVAGTRNLPAMTRSIHGMPIY